MSGEEMRGRGVQENLYDINRRRDVRAEFTGDPVPHQLLGSIHWQR